MKVNALRREALSKYRANVKQQVVYLETFWAREYP